jgi:hypothetical protein
MFVPPGAVGPGATQGIVNLNSGTDVEAGDEFIFFSLPLKQRPILAISVGAHVVFGCPSILVSGSVLHVFVFE